MSYYMYFLQLDGFFFFFLVTITLLRFAYVDNAAVVHSVLLLF